MDPGGKPPSVQAGRDFSMFLNQGGGGESAGVETVGQHAIEGRQLVRSQDIARLLQDALVALIHLLEEIVNFRLRAQEDFVGRAGDAHGEFGGLGGNNLPKPERFTVAVQLVAQGGENSLGFSLSFDPATVRFLNATLGSGASGAVLYENTNQVPSGICGLPGWI